MFTAFESTGAVGEDASLSLISIVVKSVFVFGKTTGVTDARSSSFLKSVFGKGVYVN